MKKSIVINLFLMLMVQWSVFAGGGYDSSYRHNVYSSPGVRYFIEEEYFMAGIGGGYEFGLTNFLSLGAYAGGMFGGEEVGGYEILFKPRFYPLFNGIQDLFIGINLGYNSYNYVYYDSYYKYNDYGYNSGFITGLNLGWKFVFGNGSRGFSVEPSVGYDFIGGRINAGISLGYAWGSGTPTPRPAAAPRATSRAQDGIYVGIVTFGPNAVDITEGPVYLNPDGFNRLNNLLDSRYRRETTPGTALFYGVHQGMASMTRAQNSLPAMDNVIIITFTDGLDVSSTGLSLTPVNDPGNTARVQFGGEQISKYQEFIKKEIDTRIINGSQINAYIAPVRGDDITNLSAFEAALYSVASSGYDANGIAYVQPAATNIAGLSNMFDAIARSLVDAWSVQTFTMLTTQLSRDTQVRMTFSGENTSQEAHNALYYVEGKVTVINQRYYLTDIKFSDNVTAEIINGQIEGRIVGNMVMYDFSAFRGFNLSTAQLGNFRQWIRTVGETDWQINSEYSAASDTVNHELKNNALIYLVLDQSSSISQGDIPDVRKAAKEFIQMLYSAYNKN